MKSAIDKSYDAKKLKINARRLARQNNLTARLKNAGTMRINKKYCVEDYYTAMDDCNEDSIYCSAFAIVLAAEGIWPGVVAAVGCVTVSRNCKERASRNYYTCERR